MNTLQTAIIVNNLAYCYPPLKKPIIQGINFGIKTETITSVLGQNGSGKTTLLLLFLGFIKPNLGEIRYPMMLNKNNGIHPTIAYLPQNETISYDLLVIDYVTMGRIPFIGRFQTPSIEDQTIVLSILDALSLFDIRNKRLGEISGGEYQRMRIARALAQEASILIFDEPMTYLDIKNRKKMYGLFQKLKNDGKTIIFSSHDPNDAFQIAEHCLLLGKEQQYVFGDVDDVLTSKNLSKYLDTQVFVKDIEGQKVVITKEL